jgi:membrane-associated HD superfamily phosphohydrolase
VELAQEYKLPEVIVDIIRQHHGTSLVSFFYQEAVYDDKYKTVDEEEFRYDGPKPQTKEAALIMLADMAEAAVRSNISVQNNPDRMEKFVRDLINKKLDDGQLDESDLTLKDLNKITTSFVNILRGIFHHRIEYPDNIAQEFEEADEKNESDD